MSFASHLRPSKRTRYNAAPFADQKPLLQPLYCVTQAHTFGATTIDGNAQVQLGDSHHHYNSGSQVRGPLSVAGDMIINHNYVSHRQLSPETPVREKPLVALKRTLYYHAMENRQAQLVQVDSDSLDWIWTETSFPAWLESGTGLYWICGKPASGKSTLINHLIRSESARVKKHMGIHTGADPLLIHFFFDFKAGSTIANTIVGLLRSFLLHLVEESHAVGEYVLGECGYRLEGSWPDLQMELFDLVCESTKREDRTICGFIDGLDEYSGDLLLLADFITQLHRKSNLRLCVASRPHAELKHKFGTASFEMQSHNHATIRAYAHTSLMALETHFSPSDLQETITRIETDAAGVILWARFAVDHIVSAILHGASLRSALEKLEDFPLELGEVYQHILDRLSTTQKMQAAVVFFILEYWRPSWGRGYATALSVDSMMILHSRILYELDDPEYADFTSDNDTSRFCLKIRSMLQGLVAFAEYYGVCSTPNLMHKTIDGYLRSSGDYALLKERIIKIVDPTTLGPVFLCHNLITADKSLRGSVEDIKYSERAVKNLYVIPSNIAWNYPKVAPWYLAATKTSLWRQNHLDRKGNDWPALSTARYERIKEQYPELIHFIRFKHNVLVDLACEDPSYNLSEEDKIALRSCFEKQMSVPPRYPWGFEPESGIGYDPMSEDDGNEENEEG